MPDDVLPPFGPDPHPQRECGCLCGPACTATPSDLPAPREAAEVGRGPELPRGSEVGRDPVPA